jgi:hypothetical protein
MRRAYCCLLTTFIFVLGCAQNQDTVGFPGKHQDRLQSASRDYDQREEVDDDALNFQKGNFDPDPDVGYF